VTDKRSGTGRNAAEDAAITPGTGHGGGTVNQTPKPAWQPNPNQRKPFEPEHTLSLVHGGNSDRTIAARAELVRPRLYEVCPWLHDTMDVVAVDRFLRAEARALILHAYIIEVTAEKGAGKVPSRLWEQATAADNLAAKLGHTLGLDPTGRAKLKQTVASTEHTLSDLMAWTALGLVETSAL